jgi:hypothetical protein
MNFFRNHDVQTAPSVDDAERQLLALRAAHERTKAEHTAQQQARDAAIKEIGELKSRASLEDGEARAELLNKAELLTREKLLLCQVEMATTEQALKNLSRQLTDAEDTLTRASWEADRTKLEALLARYANVSGLLDEITERLLEHVAVMGELTPRIESGLDKLRNTGRAWGGDTPKFDRMPVVSTLSNRITKTWNSGVSAGERHGREPYQAPEIPIAPPMPSLSEGEGETTEAVDGHVWSYLKLDTTEDRCNRDARCSETAVARLTYAPPDAKERSWLGCERHLEDFRRKYFRGPREFVGR